MRNVSKLVNASWKASLISMDSCNNSCIVIRAGIHQLCYSTKFKWGRKIFGFCKDLPNIISLGLFLSERGSGADIEEIGSLEGPCS